MTTIGMHSYDGKMLEFSSATPSTYHTVSVL